jgi:uncharacterized RDD family membrane protein YckC
MSEVPPGWYPDPQGGPGAPTNRWWDGGQWTGHVQPAFVSGPDRFVTPDGQRLAGWWWRVLGWLIDLLAVVVLTLPITWLAQRELDRDLTMVQYDLQRQLDAGEPVAFSDFWDPFVQAYLDQWLMLIALPLVVVVAYHAGFLRWRGATPGKAALQMRVRPREADGRLPWGSVLARVGVQYLLAQLLALTAIAAGSLAVLALLYLVLFVFALADALWALGERRQTLHDLAARTVVVRLR